MARKSLLLWALLICTLSGSTPATADDASLASDWQLFNRDAVEGRPSKETVRMMVFDAYDGQQQDSRDVTYGDDVIHIESADGLDRFNGHGYRTLPRAVQDLKRTDGATYYSEPLPLQDGDSDYKVVCYYGAWAIYRDEPMTFSPSDVAANGCTHLIYSFVGLDPQSLTITILDKEYDLIRGGYKAAQALKMQNPDLKIMIAIGGWAEGGKTYSQMASTPQSRTKFVDSVVDFMKKYAFDGFDLDWEYPGATDRDGNWSDKGNFAALVEELAAAFAGPGWQLSAAVSPAIFRINDGYDVRRISAALDFINVMTYDLHGTWDNYADHHAPLTRRPFDMWATENLHADGGISYWIQKGAPAEKLVLGIPFYGRSFTLANGVNNQPRAAISGPGRQGAFTKEAGFLAYNEICIDLIEGGWTERSDPVGSPYVTKGDQWVGYDTKDSIAVKMDYVRTRRLGGAMIWAIDLDDFRGVCGDRWPLLNAINVGLGRDPVSTSTAAPVPVPEPITIAPITVAPITVAPITDAPITAAPITVEPSVSPATDSSSSSQVTDTTTPSTTEYPTESPDSTTPMSLTTESFTSSAELPTTETSSTTESSSEWATSEPIDAVTGLPTTEATSTSTPEPDSSAVPVAFGCAQDGWFVHPQDCGRFYRCYAGTAFHFDCPPTLFFDEGLLVCNWPYQTKCHLQQPGA